MQSKTDSMQTEAILELAQASAPVPDSWKKGEHVTSNFLTFSENMKVLHILGDKRKVISLIFMTIILRSN